MPGLGRLPAFDERSRAFPIRGALPDTIVRKSKTWACPVWLDQGEEPTCVGHGWAHELLASPIRVPATHDTAELIYHTAQDLDQWPGTNYDGTSVLAGAKAVQQMGHMPEYRWGFSLDDALDTISVYGPVVIGITWYESMFTPDPKTGLLTVGGNAVGGHCVLVRGIAVARKWVRIRNSWGRSWGIDGDARITWADFGRLLAQDGECLVPVKRVA